jgi:hypothetical protein
MEFNDIEPLTFTDAQWSAIKIVTTASASLGVLGALITCVAYLYWKHMRTAIAQIIFYMAIADLCSSISMAIGRLGPASGTDSALCQLQAAGQQWGDISSILWTCMISINLIWIMFRGRAVEDLQRYTHLHLVICFLLPVIWAIVPIFVRPENSVRMYGDADLWCWISPKHSTAQMMLFYVPLWIVFVFNLITYLIVGRAIWRRARYVVNTSDMTDLNNYRHIYSKNVSLYLLAFLLTWTPATLNRIYTMAFHGHRSFVLALLHGMFTPSRGMINCLVYFYISWFTQVRAASHQHGFSTAGVIARPGSMSHTSTYDTIHSMEYTTGPSNARGRLVGATQNRPEGQIDAEVIRFPSRPGSSDGKREMSILLDNVTGAQRFQYRHQYIRDANNTDVPTRQRDIPPLPRVYLANTHRDPNF